MKQSPESIEQFACVARNAALAGGKKLLEMRSSFEAREKAECDFVTTADVASQREIYEVIREHYPTHTLVGEEDEPGAATADPDAFCWVVDPLDGTTNYLHQFPFYAVSIALAQRGALLAGAIYDPLHDQLFWAGKDHGAWLGEQRIRVSQTRSLNQALVSMSLPPQVNRESPDLSDFFNVVQKCRAVRRTGSAALNLAYLASGLLDGYWARQIKPWDVAAGVLLTQEAGGQVTNSRGGEFDLWKADLVAGSTPGVVQELLDEMS